jgi:hypothetical protein
METFTFRSALRRCAKLGIGMLLVASSCSDGNSSGTGGSAGGDGGTTSTCIGNACNARDLAGSPECEAFCNKLRAACGPNTRCDESFWCRIRTGECEASTRERLLCMASDKGGTVMCLDNGWSIANDQCSFSSSESCPDGG